jgi:hypothetical protein
MIKSADYLFSYTRDLAVCPVPIKERVSTSESENLMNSFEGLEA